MDSKNMGVNTIKEGFWDEICGTRARVVCQGNVSVERFSGNTTEYTTELLVLR